MKLKEIRYHHLLKLYKNNIYGYSFYMLKNREDADDVTQEVIIKIWENLNAFKLTSAKAWIIKTTHNLCIDYLRKRNISIKRECTMDDDFSESFIDVHEENNPMLTTHFRLMSNKVKTAIEKLPEKLRSIFILYEVQGLKYKEISLALDIPINSVKVYLMRARKKLQEELKSYEVSEVL
jgi:RNA polymerase sigma factor (sigma-70 family)